VTERVVFKTDLSVNFHNMVPLKSQQTTSLRIGSQTRQLLVANANTSAFIYSVDYQ
jgi:hypothetical protein